MQDKKFTIMGYFEYAVFQGDFQSVKALLSENHGWVVKVLEGTDVKPRIVDYIRKFSSCHPANIKNGKDRAITAIGPIGKKQYLAYQVKPHQNGGIEITPMPYLGVRYKLGISLMLSLAYIVPVVLSPLVWRKYAQNNLKLSRYYLTSFCHYIEERLA